MSIIHSFTLNVLFLACTIFGGKSVFFLQVSVDLNWRISNCAYSYAYTKNGNCLFDSAETTFRQKNQKENKKGTQKKNIKRKRKNESKMDSQM